MTAKKKAAKKKAAAAKAPPGTDAATMAAAPPPENGNPPPPEGAPTNNGTPETTANTVTPPANDNIPITINGEVKEIKKGSTIKDLIKKGFKYFTDKGKEVAADFVPEGPMVLTAVQQTSGG